MEGCLENWSLFGNKFHIINGERNAVIPSVRAHLHVVRIQNRLHRKYDPIFSFYYARNVRPYIRKKPHNLQFVQFADYQYLDNSDEFFKRSYRMHEIPDRIRLLEGTLCLIQRISNEIVFCTIKPHSSSTIKYGSVCANASNVESRPTKR